MNRRNALRTLLAGVLAGAASAAASISKPAAIYMGTVGKSTVLGHQEYGVLRVPTVLHTPDSYPDEWPDTFVEFIRDGECFVRMDPTGGEPISRADVISYAKEHKFRGLSIRRLD